MRCSSQNLEWGLKRDMKERENGMRDQREGDVRIRRDVKLKSSAVVLHTTSGPKMPMVGPNVL